MLARRSANSNIFVHDAVRADVVLLFLTVAARATADAVPDKGFRELIFAWFHRS